MTTCLNAKLEEVRSAGKAFYAPSVVICGRTVVVTGKRIRMAQVKDEEVVEGVTVAAPETFIAKLKESELKADLFTFAQRPPEITPKYGYHLEWENWAVAATTSFNEWWENRLPQETRKNVRRAAKRGVVVKIVPLDDNFVKGVHRIYNETPVRGGRFFWHFGKDVETVKRGLTTYLDRSDFIGAYWNEELIGFIKIVYVDDIANLIHIISMNEHYDKRPMNALIAKAMELCQEKGISQLVYGRFVYGNNRQGSFVEFKRRNGFEQVNFPRYYVPLSLKGKVFVNLRLYRGLGGLIPEPFLQPLLRFRNWYCKAISTKPHSATQKFAGVAQRQSD
jgi:hypothetical protein